MTLSTFNRLAIPSLNTMLKSLFVLSHIITIVNEIINQNETRIKTSCDSFLNSLLHLHSLRVNEETHSSQIFTLSSQLDIKPDIDTFLNFLHCNTNLVFLLLSSCGDYDSKKLLGNYIANFFYTNPLSDKCINDELLLLLFRSLEQEINERVNKDNIPALFLDSGVNIFLLRSIIRLPKVQRSLSQIFKQILIEINEIPFEMTCELKKLIDDDVTENDVRDLLLEFDTVKGDYSQTLDVEVLRAKKEKQNDEEVKKYIDIHIKECEEYKDNKLFAGDAFLDKICAVESGVLSETVLDRYCYHISQIATIVIKIIKILTENVELLPSPVRQICKMISILVSNKFKDIPTVRVNAFISRFFIDILFDEFLSPPTRFKLLPQSTLSPNIENNKNIVFKVLHYLFMGYFFDVKMNQNFAIFNWVFIQAIPDVIELLDRVCNVEMPVEGNEKKVTVIPYTNEVVLKMYDILSKNAAKMQKTVSVTDSMKTFKFLKIIENNMKQIKEISQKEKNDKKFSVYATYSIDKDEPLKEIDVEVDNDELKKKLLELCRKLNEYQIDLTQCEDKSTLGVINFLLKASAIGIFPKKEYAFLIKIKSLLEKTNLNLKNFYQTTIQQMKAKIEEIEFKNKNKELHIIDTNKKELDEEIEFYQNLQIKEDIVPLADRKIIEMKLNNKKYFYDYDKQFNEVIANKWYPYVVFRIGDFSHKSIRDYYYNAGYYSLNQFIALFPDIVSTEKEKVFDFIKANRINLFVDNFIKALNQGMPQLKLDKAEEYISSIKNLFFSRIYYKIYPFKPLPNDIALHKSTENNSWITLNVLTQKEVDVDVLIPLVKEQLKMISQRKSYDDKVNTITKLFEIITDFLKENGLKNENINVYLLYLINKSKPYRLYSDIEFVSKFNVEDNKEITLNIQMMSYCVNLLLNLNEEDLKNFLTPQ